MADRKRRDDDAADDDQLDEALFEDDDESPADEDDDTPVSRSSRGATVTKPRDEGPKLKRETERVGLFARFLRFIREIVAELRKVIWPTRKELLTYTTVVIVFVAVLMAIVALLDLGFAKAVLWVFGDPSKD